MNVMLHHVRKGSANLLLRTHLSRHLFFEQCVQFSTQCFQAVRGTQVNTPGTDDTPPRARCNVRVHFVRFVGVADLDVALCPETNTT